MSGTLVLANYHLLYLGRLGGLVGQPPVAFARGRGSSTLRAPAGAKRTRRAWPAEWPYEGLRTMATLAETVGLDYDSPAMDLANR
jgi:hypothetical protein